MPPNMQSLQALLTTLLDLARALEGTEVPLTVGGGLGLYLKQVQLQEAGTRTLLDELPEPRATNDIDLFIRTEVLVRLEAMQAVAACLRKLGFEAIEGAKYFHWERPMLGAHAGRAVKLDLLVGPLGEFSSQLKTDKLPRVRPKGSLKLHARHTEEAIEIDTKSVEMPISGDCSDGAAYSTTIFIPPAFTYLMMKLFAYNDRKDDARSDLGRHHAMDLYRIVAMMDEPEYEQARELAQFYANDDRVHRAREIIKTDLATPTSRGVLRLREHALFRESLQVDEFIDVLGDLFVSS